MEDISLNIWLETYGRRIDKLVYELEKYRLNGSYGGNLNLGEIISLFKGAKLEITNLGIKLIKLKEIEIEKDTMLKLMMDGGKEKTKNEDM